MIQRYISQNEIKLIGQVDLFYVLPAGCVKPDLKKPLWDKKQSGNIVLAQCRQLTPRHAMKDLSQKIYTFQIEYNFR